MFAKQQMTMMDMRSGAEPKDLTAAKSLASEKADLPPAAVFCHKAAIKSRGLA
jgi:hypothetical protein